MQEDYLNQSIEAANYIQQSFVKNLKRKNRTVKQAGFLVLRNTYMPSVLVETGFLTNSKEGAYLNSKRGQTEISRAIAKAIMEYKSSLDGTLFTGLVMDTAPDKISSTTTANSSAAATTFRIQIAASTKKMALKPYNFKGLTDVSRIKTGSLYRYYYGSFSSYISARKAISKLVKKGYKGAYIKAFEGNNEVSITLEMKSK
jgi:N-acetylmuramoyl-L-alanine amidase